MKYDVYAGIRSLNVVRKVDSINYPTESGALEYARLCAYRLYQEAEKYELVPNWHDCACSIYDCDCMGNIEWDLMGIDPNDDWQIADVNQLYDELLEEELIYYVTI